MKSLLSESCHICTPPDWPLSDAPGHVIFPRISLPVTHHLNRMQTFTVFCVVAWSKQTEWKIWVLIVFLLFQYSFSGMCSFHSQCYFSSDTLLNSGEMETRPRLLLVWFEVKSSHGYCFLCLMFCFLRRKLSLRYSCKIRIQNNLIILQRNLTRAGREKKSTPIVTCREHF